MVGNKIPLIAEKVNRSRLGETFGGPEIDTWCNDSVRNVRWTKNLQRETQKTGNANGVKKTEGGG